MRRISRLPKPLRLGPTTVSSEATTTTSTSCSARFYHHATARQQPTARLWTRGATLTSSPAHIRAFGTTPIRLDSPKQDDKKPAAPAAVEEEGEAKPVTAAQETTTQLEAAKGEQSNNVAAAAEAEAEAETEAEAEIEEVDADYEAATSSVGDLVVPGRFSSAPATDEISDTSYVPAQSGEGLQEVGGLDGWWEDNSHWDPAVEYRGFSPRGRVNDAAVLEVLARQAVLEALAVREANGSTTLTEAWSRNPEKQQSAALGLKLELAADGSVKGLQGDVASVVEGLKVAEEEESAGAEENEVTLSPEEASELIRSWDASWKEVSLEDAALQFAITKRILQLTGHILPDAYLMNARTVGDLVAVLIKPPKAKTLAQELEENGSLDSLPNVQVFARRVTPIDKHQRVGRWKVIVQELEKRGLPVTGTAGYGKKIERKWVNR